MNTVVLQQLQLINKHWVAYKPKTQEQKEYKAMMISALKESIADIKRELKAHDYFEAEDMMEIEA